MFKKFAITALAASVALMSGCAGFTADRLSKVSEQDLRSTAPVKTKVYSSWTVLSPAGVPMGDQVGKTGAEANKKRFETALKTSECCIVVDNARDADLVVEGNNHTEEHQGAAIGAFITGFSLFAIPSWATINLHITATAKTATLSRSYDLDDGMTMVMWLPMVLAMPFTGNPIKAGEAVEQNVFDTLVVKMKSDGLLK